MIATLPEWLFHWAGYLGVAFYLGSYALLQAGVIRGSSLTYTLMNLAAAALVLLSLTVAFNLSSALIQISWIVISLAGLARMTWQNTRLRFSETEVQMLRGPLAQMPAAMARRFFDAGLWQITSTEVAVTTEGEPVEALHYLADGRAEIGAGGVHVARLTVGFIGELNVMEGGPASATVTVARGSQLFTISGRTLRRMVDRDAEFRMILDRALTRDTAQKLDMANKIITGRDVNQRQIGRK